MANSSQSIDYKKLNNELDNILNELQSADLDIDESIKLYEKGMKLIDKLQAYLKGAENKVNKVKKSWDK